MILLGFLSLQTLLPSAISEEVESQETPKNQKNNSMNSSFTVRSDSKTRKLDAYFVPDLTGTKASDAEKSIVQDDDSRMADLNLAFERCLLLIFNNYAVFIITNYLVCYL